MIDAALNNSWQLQGKNANKSLDLLAFQRIMTKLYPRRYSADNPELSHCPPNHFARDSIKGLL